MPTLTENEMFESAFSSARDDSYDAQPLEVNGSYPSLEEMKQRAEQERQRALARVPVIPMTQSSQAPQNETTAFADGADEVLESIEEEEKDNEKLSEVEFRLEKANCYKALLENSLFDSTSKVVNDVENEVRSFIKQRLRVLMGLEQEQLAANSFSKEELMALKHLASRVMSKTPSLSSTPKVEKPSVPEPPRVNKTRVSAPSKKVEVVGNSVPEKVKPPRKKKDEIEVTLPNGQVVKTTADTTQNGIKKRSLQEIADAAASKAMAQVQTASQSAQLNQMLSTVK